MSNNSARRAPESSSGAQLSRASSASSRGVMISKARPISWRTRAMNAAPLTACRHASVATARTARGGRRSNRAATACSASMARSIAASFSRPVAPSPSPKRTTRLKLSTTRNPSRAGMPASMRQLLVPRSMAAHIRSASRSVGRSVGCPIGRSGLDPPVMAGGSADPPGVWGSFRMAASCLAFAASRKPNFTARAPVPGAWLRVATAHATSRCSRAGATWRRWGIV